MPTDKKSLREYEKNFKEWMNAIGINKSHLEKPAMYTALGNINGKKVLCLGCGSGEECAKLISLGAKEVIGVDISNGLINTAKEKFPDIEFKVMDMEQLKFKRDSFDIVYSSLVLHYVKDWTKPFLQVKKILKKNGTFLFSTHNPADESAQKIKKGNEKLKLLGYKENKKTGKLEIYGDYLNVRKIHTVWSKGFHVTYYYKPFSSIINDIVSSGLSIVECIEPKPIRSAKKIDPNFYEKNSKLPSFIIFKLKK